MASLFKVIVFAIIALVVFKRCQSSTNDSLDRDSLIGVWSMTHDLPNNEIATSTIQFTDGQRFVMQANYKQFKSAQITGTWTIDGNRAKCVQDGQRESYGMEISIRNGDLFMAGAKDKEDGPYKKER